MDSVNEQVDALVESAKKNQGKSVVVAKKETTQHSDELGNCPFCGRPMRENSKSFYCTGYEDGCNFSIWKEIAGKKITKATAKNLILKGKTGKLKGFTSKSGKKFDAILVVNKNTHKIEFKF